ncbi:MAG TPA: ATP-binding protein [Candidatus Nitrosopolaris sp.]|nr:ATP-binding protein [Candidatus Nitrosopolaris sp.]
MARTPSEPGNVPGREGGPAAERTTVAPAEQAALLVNVSTLLAGSLDYQETLEQLAQLAVQSIADWCIIDMLDEDETPCRRAVAHRDPAKAELAREIERWPPREGTTPSALTHVLRTGASGFYPVASRAAELVTETGELRRRFLAVVRPLSVMIVPLAARGRILGAITFVSTESSRRYDRSDLSLAEELARRAALAADNALLYREARAAERRAAFLAEASRMLADSLDYTTTLGSVVRLAVPFLADWCTAVLLQEDGSLRQVAEAHVDPARVELVRRLGHDREPADAPSPLQLAMQKGGAQLLPEISDDLLQRLSRTSEHLETLRQLGPRCAMLVPLVARGRMLGGLAFVATDARPVYHPGDLAVAEDLARRAALALDNARLYRQAQDARLQAEGANRAKDEFLSVVSHELRTPLTPILAWARMLRRGGFEPGVAARALDVIERNARSQAQLVEDLLDVSRIISGKLRLEVRSLELGSVVEGATEAARPAADAKGIRLVSLLDPSTGQVEGDGERLRQVVANLLSNAIKFTPSGGRVEVRLRRLGGTVVLSVLDTGKGIAPEFLPHLFERFRQADSSSTRSYGGLGVGLAIVRHVVELHGGAVRATSDGEGRGATFTVTLPATDTRPPAGEPAERLDATAYPALEGLHVLVVDDEPDTCDLLATLLSRCGAETRTACSAAEARTLFARWKVDVLVSDLGMPGEDGFALLRDLRSRAGARGDALPAIALTAYARAEDRVKVLASGFERHVVKPIEPSELVSIVADVAGRI